jgi:pyruvate/2-oxoglutarate dehydrogenase complex dihydrolipoamide dehydrogenase (E3) component
MTGVRARKRQMVDDLIRIHLDKYRASGAELIMGEARFIGGRTVQVTGQYGPVRMLSGDQVFLNLGTHAVLPEIPGLQEAGPMTHVEALELDRLPEHLVVLGGGFVGLEFAQAMRRFGSRVTLLERGPHLARGEDPDASGEILRIFKREGISVLLNTHLAGVSGVSGREIRVRLVGPEGERAMEASDLLVAAGRKPNTRGLGLEHAGVELDERGYIRVNGRLQTTAPGVWAMGECAGSPQFTHIAFDDFRIVRDNVTGGNRTTIGRIVPFCLFTDPEFARIGLNETEARRLGVPYRAAKTPAAGVLRTRTLSETDGFLKALIGAETDEILGFSALCPQAGEVMAIVQTAMMARIPWTGLRDAIFAHPTMAEGLNVLFSSAPARTEQEHGNANQPHPLQRSTSV